MKKIVRTAAAIALAIALADVPFTIGQVNGSGVGKYLYFIPSSDITQWPTITDNMADAASAGAYIGYTGSFTLATGAKWIKIYNTQGEGEMSADPTGETDCKMYVNKLKFRFPKLTDQALTLADAVVNGDGVFIAWHDGAYRVIGHPHYRTTVNPNANSGNSAGSSKGITFEAECPDNKILPAYVGNIVLDDGTLNCSTDTFTPKGQS